MFFRQRQLNQLKNQSKPDKSFRSNLWVELSNEFDQTYASPAPRRRRIAFASAALVIVLFTTGTGVYAYESPEVIDGHPLHFMKTSIETIEEQFARSPESRAEFHDRMVERREQELEQLIETYPEAEERIRKRMDHHKERAQHHRQRYQQERSGVVEDGTRHRGPGR